MQNDSKNPKGITHNIAPSMVVKLQLLDAYQLALAESLLDAMIAFSGNPTANDPAHDTTTLQVSPTGELVTIDIEVCSTKTRAILTHAQAKALRDALDDAIGKTAYTILQRQQEAYLQAADAEPCPTCEGTGKLPDHDAPYGFTGVNVCKDCSGTGEVQS